MKMMIFDTETTGIPLWHEPSDDPRQPYLVQYTAVLFDEATGDEQSFVSKIVRPDGWSIAPELTALHGISNAQALDEGEPLRVVVSDWLTMTAQADVVAAFGIGFDMRIMRIAMLRAGLSKEACNHHTDTIRTHDVQRHVTALCRVPPTDKMMAAGRKTWKTPTLTEAVKALLGEDLEDAHDSRADVLATKRIHMAVTRGTHAMALA
jgi:DNA polymerase III subunit epsilon